MFNIENINIYIYIYIFNLFYLINRKKLKEIMELCVFKTLNLP